MLKLALTCPGQGILPQGCLHGFRKYQKIFQSSLDCVDEVLGERFSAKLLETPPQSPDKWNLSTANAQPAILASTYITTQILKELHGVDLQKNPKISFLLGHSLGEYSALLLGGVLSLPQAVSVVRQRGLLMENLVKDQSYEMRVLLFRPNSHENVVKTATEHQVLACENSVGQVSISGPPKTLDAVVAELNTPKKTILRQSKLPVQIPFHNQIIESIEPELRSLVSTSRQSTIPIVTNATGRISEGNLYENAVKCNSLPVLWKQSMEYVISQGVDGVINLGPGNAVEMINQKFDVKNSGLRTLEDMESLAKVIEV